MQKVLDKRNLHFLYPALLQRTRELLQSGLPPAKIEYAILRQMDRAPERFSPHYSLQWTYFDAMVHACEEDVPEGAWEEACWEWYLPASDRRKRSANYWLGLWKDAQEANKPEIESRARAGIMALMGKTEEVVEV